MKGFRSALGKNRERKSIEPHKIAVQWLFMTSNRYKTTLMNIFVVFQRKSFADCRVSFQKCVDSFAKPENVRQTCKKQIDKFLLIDAWQESMKWLLTFTLSQSGEGKWRFYTFNLPCLLSFDRKLIFSNKRNTSGTYYRRGQDRVCQMKTHTLCIFCVREFVIMAVELIISFIWIVEIPDWWKSLEEF